VSRTTSQCWHVVRTASREPWDEDRDPCSPSRRQARRRIARIRAEYEPDPPDLDVEARPHPCLSVQCDTCCGWLADEDGLGRLHIAAGDRYGVVEDAGWRDVDGRDLCPPCLDEQGAPAGPGPLDQPLPGLEPTR
jgi:hypothetical protein